MRFLLRLTFWLSVILILLPSSGARVATTSMTAVEAITAAKATVSDMRSFCERQPEACAVGSEAAKLLGQRAEVGAKLLYEYIHDRLASPDAAAPSLASGRAPPAAGRPTQHTLSSADLIPPWRGPPSRKETAAQY